MCRRNLVFVKRLSSIENVPEVVESPRLFPVTGRRRPPLPPGLHTPSLLSTEFGMKVMYSALKYYEYEVGR